MPLVIIGTGNNIFPVDSNSDCRISGKGQYPSIRYINVGFYGPLSWVYIGSDCKPPSVTWLLLLTLDNLE